MGIPAHIGGLLPTITHTMRKKNNDWEHHIQATSENRSKVVRSQNEGNVVNLSALPTAGAELTVGESGAKEQCRFEP